MASDGKIILFDIPSKAGTAWSFNTWRSTFTIMENSSSETL